MDIFLRSAQTSASTKSDFQKEIKWKEDCNLELVSTQKSDRFVDKFSSILTLMTNLWQNAIAAPTQEPQLKIWQKQDRYGHIHWHANDPSMGKSVSFASELEMRRWIENLYSRNRW
jgi:hypothetical protein